MGLIYTNQKSKKKNKTQKEIAEYNAWLDSVKSQKTNFGGRYGKPKKVEIKKSEPYRRETPYYPSLNSGFHDTSKKPVPVYTGDKMVGIGTLHKSNAVPIFSVEEALDQATMRR